MKMTTKKTKAFALVLLLIYSCIVLSSCWNYKEIEDLAIIAGVALDKKPDGSLKLTAEIADITANGAITYKPVVIEIEGETFFDASRRAITLEGKRLYWSHAKVVIVSQEIAKEDINRYLDFLFRDAEAREDIWLLVSREQTAGEIFKGKGELIPIVSFEIDEAMRSQRAISRFPLVELYEFFDRIFDGTVAPILPTIKLAESEGGKTPQVEGTVIFKNGKMISMLDVEHTKDMLWLRDELEGGLVILENVSDTQDDVTLEIFRSNSKITPYIQDGVLKMKAEIDLVVNLAELMGVTDYFTSEGKEKLEKFAEKRIEQQIKETYTEVRDIHKADIFGFGRRIDMKLPYVWNQIKDKWDEMFAELELDVKVNVKIRGSATTRTPLKAGE